MTMAPSTCSRRRSPTHTSPTLFVRALLLSIGFLLSIATTHPSRAPCYSVSAFAPVTRTRTRQRYYSPSSRRSRRGSTGTCSSTALGAQILTDLVNEYQYLTSTFPLATQSATFGTFAGVGDALAQTKEGSATGTAGGKDSTTTSSTERNEEELESRIDGYDPSRSARFVLKGLGAGLIWSAWYPFADGWSSQITSDVLTQFHAADIGTTHTIAKTVTSILLEQFVACPIVYSLWDIPVPALLSGAKLGSLPGTVREKVPGLLLDNAKVWTVANVVVYNLPVEWRVFFVSVCEIFWASIVSSVATGETTTTTGTGSGSTACGDESNGADGNTAAAAALQEDIRDEILDIIAAEKREKIEIVSQSTGYKRTGVTSNRS